MSHRFCYYLSAGSSSLPPLLTFLNKNYQHVSHFPHLRYLSSPVFGLCCKVSCLNDKSSWLCNILYSPLSLIYIQRLSLAPHFQGLMSFCRSKGPCFSAVQYIYILDCIVFSLFLNMYWLLDSHSILSPSHCSAHLPRMKSYPYRLRTEKRVEIKFDAVNSNQSFKLSFLMLVGWD